MGIDITQWRVEIARYWRYVGRTRRSRGKSQGKKTASSAACNPVLALMLAFCLMTSPSLLLQAGDVERNPGPESIKCVLVGDSYDNMKTTLLISYTTNTFAHNCIPTVFDDFAVTVLLSGEIWTLSLFDASDQEDYDRLRPLTYSRTDVFLVCFSVASPETFENVKRKWVPEITIHCPEARFLLVGLQVHLRSDATMIEDLAKRGLHPITAQQGKRMAREMGAAKYIECSAQTPGLNNVFEEAIITALEEPSKQEIDLRITFLKKNRISEKNAIKMLVAMKKREEKEAQERSAADQALFEEAVKYGYIESRSLSSLLIGAAGTGKTHVKHLIFKRPPPLESVSTPLAERPVRAVRAARLSGTTDDDWSEIDDEKLDDMLAQAMNAGVKLTKVGKFASLARKFLPSRRRPLKFSNSTEDDPLPTDEAAINPSSPDTDAMTQGHSNTGSRLELLRAVQAETTKLLEKVGTSRQSEVGLVPEQLTGVVDWVYLLDSGGQRHFHEILPAFLPHVAVTMFVLKLCEPLEHIPIAEYRTKEGKYRLDSSFTNKDVLFHCSQTIQSLQGKTNTPSSKVVVIGTHRDLENEPREQKNAELIKLFAPTFEKHLVYHKEQLSELIFPVNAKSPEEEDKDVARELRKVILDAASHVQRKKTPISWFVLEQMIHRMAAKLGRGVLSRDECLLIAEYLEIPKKHVDTMLRHFASLNMLHYYRNVLPEAVFSDPQVIMDKVSELVQYHCKLNSELNKTKAASGDLRKFRDEGCINVKLLTRFSKHYTNIFTPDSFLMILIDRLIAAQQIGVDNYFMPSLLPMLKREELSIHRVDSSSFAAPLVICFQNEWAPFGVFCSLVAFLRSSYNPNLWELSPNPDLNPTQPNCLTRNCVEFQLPDNAPGTVTLIDSLAYFEVHVNAPQSICSQLCHTIHQTIISGLHKAAETLHYQVLNVEVAFLCEDRHKSSNSDEDDSACTASHVARVWKQQWWKCSINARISAKLKERHLLWFKATSSDASNLKPLDPNRVYSEPINNGSTPSLRADSTNSKPLNGASNAFITPVQADSTNSKPLNGASNAFITPVQANQPTLLELLRLHGKKRTINIPQEISTHSKTFGILLLEDSTGSRVRNIAALHRDNPENMNIDILEEWVEGRGRRPVTWDTLVAVLQDTGLTNLANEIAAEKCLVGKFV